MFNDDDWFGVGLQLWLIFMVLFFLLGYPAQLSIGLGAIGGLAGGFVSAYVRGKNQTPPSEAKDSDKTSPLKQAQERFIKRWRRDEPNDSGSKKFGASARGRSARQRRRTISRR
jgi:Sec-independent protein translocase protein TatA